MREPFVHIAERLVIRQIIGQSRIMIVTLRHQLCLNEHGFPYCPRAFDDYYFAMRLADLVGEWSVNVSSCHRKRLYITGRKSTFNVSFFVHSMYVKLMECLLFDSSSGMCAFMKVVLNQDRGGSVLLDSPTTGGGRFLGDWTKGFSYVRSRGTSARWGCISLRR